MTTTGTITTQRGGNNNKLSRVIPIWKVWIVLSAACHYYIYRTSEYKKYAQNEDGEWEVGEEWDFDETNSTIMMDLGRHVFQGWQIVGGRASAGDRPGHRSGGGRQSAGQGRLGRGQDRLEGGRQGLSGGGGRSIGRRWRSIGRRLRWWQCGSGSVYWQRSISVTTRFLQKHQHQQQQQQNATPDVNCQRNGGDTAERQPAER